MWEQKLLVFTVIVVILLQQSEAQDAPAPRPVQVPNPQIILNFFLNEREDIPKQYWRRVSQYRHKDCECKNCDCEDCICEECECKKDESKSNQIIHKIDDLNDEYPKGQHYLHTKTNDCDCIDCDCENCDCIDCDCENCNCKNKDKNLQPPRELSNLIYIAPTNTYMFVKPTNISVVKPRYELQNRFGGWFAKLNNAFKSFLYDIHDDIQEIKCRSCVETVDIFLDYRRNNKKMSVNSLPLLATHLCSIIYSDKFCEGIVNLHFDLIMYILDSRPELTGETICSITGQALGCFVPRESNKFNSWKVDIPPLLNTFKPNHTNIKYDSNTLQILQIADIHYDPKYRTGYRKHCNEPICCRTELELLNVFDWFDGGAGQWGNYEKCDMPIEAVKNLIQQTSKHDVKYVYFTGDVIAHNMWETSIESNSNNIIEIYRTLYHTFISRNITLYPILGNHEFHPVNSNPPKDGPKKFSQQWLFDLIAELWGIWLPEETLETIRHGGFYTVVPKPGFRIIALNSNVAYVYNWWLLYNDTDPYGQLQWLADTLYLAEQNNEYVHILSHVPPGEKDTYAKWAHEYSRIIRRFSHIITGQFCGHTHNVEMYYFYKPNTIEQPINIMYNGGSVTTYQNNNPNFRVYDIHPESMIVENFKDWFYNLTDANEVGRPQWSYTDFKQQFGLKSMSYKEMGQLIFRMIKNKSHLDIYFRHKIRFGDASLKEGCDDNCMIKNLCKIFKTEADSNELCNFFVNQFKRNYDIKY